LIYRHTYLRSLPKKRAAGGEESIGVEVSSVFGEIEKPTKKFFAGFIFLKMKVIYEFTT